MRWEAVYKDGSVHTEEELKNSEKIGRKFNDINEKQFAPTRCKPNSFKRAKLLEEKMKNSSSLFEESKSIIKKQVDLILATFIQDLKTDQRYRFIKSFIKSGIDDLDKLLTKKLLSLSKKV